MAITKNKLKTNFTMVPNYIINNEKLTSNSFELLVYIWSKPTNWEINQKNIAKEFGVHINTINRWLKELKDNDFIKVKKINKGQCFEYIYELVDDTPNIVSSDVDNTPSHDTPSHDTPSSGVYNNTEFNNTEFFNNNTDDNKTKPKAINTYFENQEINDLFNDFLENRKEIFGKKINTSRSIKLLVNKLNDKSDEEKKIMIKKSIENGWKGLFESQNKNTKKEIGNTKDWYQEEKDGELSKEEIDEMNEIIEMM